MERKESFTETRRNVGWGVFTPRSVFTNFALIPDKK
jgi:hypothetical protein